MLIRQNQGGQILQGHPGESEVGERPVEVMVLEDVSGKTGEGRQGSEGPNQDDNRGTIELMWKYWVQNEKKIFSFRVSNNGIQPQPWLFTIRAFAVVFSPPAPPAVLQGMPVLSYLTRD